MNYATIKILGGPEDVLSALATGNNQARSSNVPSQVFVPNGAVVLARMFITQYLSAFKTMLNALCIQVPSLIPHYESGVLSWRWSILEP